MKKIYVKPESTVVALNVRSNVLQASDPKYDPDQTTTETSGNLSREVIKTQDAWEEW